jgi:hypothetical protein
MMTGTLKFLRIIAAESFGKSALKSRGSATG